MNVVDTNIWIYSHDARDAVKQAKAKQVIATTRPLLLPWQVGCEFLSAARKLEPFGFTADDAWDALYDMRAMAAVLLPTSTVWDDARSLQARLSLSIWDALLVASCLSAGVQTLYTEDLGGTPTINGLVIINPFTTP